MLLEKDNLITKCHRIDKKIVRNRQTGIDAFHAHVVIIYMMLYTTEGDTASSSGAASIN